MKNQYYPAFETKVSRSTEEVYKDRLHQTSSSDSFQNGNDKNSCLR